jgi:hypothetical protein
MSSRIIYNVEHNIPRVNLSMPGRQNRSGDGCLRITPGMSEAFEFVFGNHDGVPLNLIPFTIKLIFWVKQDMDIDEMVPGQSKIVFSHTMETVEDYAGRTFCLLDDQETMLVASEQTSLVRWSLFLINDEGDVFPTEVNRNGGRAGTVRMDFSSGIPTAEMVRSA